MKQLSEFKNIVVLNPLGVIPKQPASHNRGFELMRASLFNGKLLDGNWSYADLAQMRPDAIVLTLSVNYKHDYGIIGGLSETHVERILDLLRYVSEHEPQMFNVFESPDTFKYEGFTKRVGKPSTGVKFTEDVSNQLVNLIKSSEYIPMNYFDTETITVGDSHTPAFTAKGNCAYHHNGKTLFGAMKMPLAEFVRPYITENTKRVEICLGSTDIRHHVLREKSIYKNAEDFVIAYKKQADDIEKEFGIKVVPCATMPIEHAERVIPNGNTFMGTPFYGTVEERQRYTEDFLVALRKHFDEVVEMPHEWYEMDPKTFAEKHLEKPRSVHFSPVSYRMNGQWPSS